MKAGWALLRRRDFGLLWAGGDVEADVSPNIATAAPEARVMPPERTGT